MLHRFKTDFFTTASHERRSHPFLWFIGCLLCLIVLAGQFYWTEGDKINRNPKYRVWLEKICRSVPQNLPYHLKCELPVYKNLDEFEIVHGDFQQVDDYYEFQTIFSNQADFAQNYPMIRLRLLDFNGKIFAERVFYPEEYLEGKLKGLMAASDSIEVNLKVAPPSQKVGGYTFDLM